MIRSFIAYGLSLGMMMMIASSLITAFIGFTLNPNAFASTKLSLLLALLAAGGLLILNMFWRE